VKSLFERDGLWKCAIWLDSARNGRVMVAVKSEKWAFLLPQPDYSVPLDLSPFPRQERHRKGLPGSILSAFRPPKTVLREVPVPRVKREKEKTDGMEDEESTYVDGMLDDMKTNIVDEQNAGFIKYLEDGQKISK